MGLNFGKISENKQPVIIVGAGLSGLACALTLQKSSVPFLLLEKSSSIGGKLKTTSCKKGFKLDHGFQVLLTSYPELKLFLNLKKLALKPFNSGCLIYNGSTVRKLVNPFVHPTHLISEALSNFISLKDKILVVKLIVQSRSSPSSDLKNMTTLGFLQHFGFSANFINQFWIPFLTGVYLDPHLNISAEFFMFLIKSFSSGRVAVPALGMQEIPRQMATVIDSKIIRLNAQVGKIAADHVVLNCGQRIDAKRVVVAYNPSVADTDFYSVQNLYFTTAEKLDWGSWLVIVPPELGLKISTIAIMNHVAPTYCMHPILQLLSVSIVGKKETEIKNIEQELRQICRKPLVDLSFVEKFEINNALPKMSKVSENGFIIKENIFYCGDWAASPSINGALKSGRLVAEKIISDG